MEYWDIGALLVIVGALTAATNIITEVVKRVTWDKIPTNLLVVIIAEALTLAAGAVWTQKHFIIMEWYYVAAAVVVGMFVAYAAMFGFDKFKEAMQRIVNKDE